MKSIDVHLKVNLHLIGIDDRVLNFSGTLDFDLIIFQAKGSFFASIFECKWYILFWNRLVATIAVFMTTMCILQSLKCFGYCLFTNNTLNEKEYHSTTHGILSLIVSCSNIALSKLMLISQYWNKTLSQRSHGKFLLYNKTGSYVGGMAVYKPKVYFIGHMITALSGGAIYNLNEDVGVFITIAIIILQT